MTRYKNDKVKELVAQAKGVVKQVEKNLEKKNKKFCGPDIKVSDSIKLPSLQLIFQRDDI